MLESLRSYLVITASATGALTDPGSFLRKISPCFCVWTHFNTVLLLRAFLKVLYPSKYTQGQRLLGIIQQAVMPADHRNSCSLPKCGAEIPVLTTHKLFPDQLPVWAQRQLLQLACLPSSPQQPRTEPSKRASLLRSPKC